MVDIVNANPQNIIIVGISEYMPYIILDFEKIIRVFSKTQVI
ncbi:hypothetical protein [uncultured Methanobrevibacter sp.]|nr:hypothetical protein [uncultured Methanobrevibacter sp.]